MIKILRSEEPDVLKNNARKWRDELIEAKTEKEKKRAEKRYNHRQVKNSLEAMFHSKCAYCESKITHVDYGEIEHFRPKSLFPEETFNWNNLFLSCGICNGAQHKGDKFPGADQGGPLVNPCDDEPVEHLKFVFDQQTGLASVYGVTDRGSLTEEIFGLNRVELRKYRS
ncbi:MAG: retron system putative HNH endonuclease, partial [Spirochaetota bacterium]